jgi:acyl-coenzyme A synthetase/AMP-(fatty) acid ligase
MPRFDADATIRLLEDDGLTHLVGDATVFAAVADALEVRGAPLRAPALRVCACLGVLAPLALHDRWRRTVGLELRDAFGIEEAPLLLFNAPHFPNRPGTLGVPFPGVQVTVRDAVSGVPVAHGERGALWVRGAPLFSGYTSTEHAALAQRDGWLVTRETVRLRADGALELSFRASTSPLELA